MKQVCYEKQISLKESDCKLAKNFNKKQNLISKYYLAGPEL